MSRGFAWIGEFDEARRIDDALTYEIDLLEGRYEDAIRTTRVRLQQFPESKEPISSTANVLYAAGKLDEAMPLYERLTGFVPAGHKILSYEMGIDDNETTMRLALTRRSAGDEEGAQAAARIAKRDHSRRRAAGIRHPAEYRTEAIMAAFDGDPDHALAALGESIQRGLRDPLVFSDPVFRDMQDDPRFIALQQALQEILEREHLKVLQLVCLQNPAPGEWSPMPETCANTPAAESSELRE